MNNQGQGQIEALIRELADRHFYGSLTLKFEAGRIVILKKEETLKPHELVYISRSGAGKSSVLSMFFPHPDYQEALEPYLYRLDKFTPKAFVSHAANITKEKLKEGAVGER